MVVGVSPVELAGLALLDVSLPAGTVATFVFALADGADLMAVDFNTVVVTP